MIHKKRKPIPDNHPRQRILAEIEKVKEEGIKFPEYNPPPKREIEMKSSEKRVYNSLKRKEWKRRNSASKPFIGWEYADRYVHRKVETNET